ncbi:MAG: universal stress protein, partial [Pyrinomonadaceae bacterium]
MQQGQEGRAVERECPLDAHPACEGPSRGGHGEQGRTDADAGVAILQTIKRDKFDLVAIGVSRRPGEKLSFGAIADTLLKEAKCPLLF